MTETKIKPVFFISFLEHLPLTSASLGRLASRSARQNAQLRRVTDGAPRRRSGRASVGGRRAQIHLANGSK